jgi:hypothetical protein
MGDLIAKERSFPDNLWRGKKEKIYNRVVIGVKMRYTRELQSRA